MKTLAVAACLLFLSGLPWNRLTAQQATERIEGTVTNASGAPVPHVKVELTNPATGKKRTADTDPNGHYRFDAVAVGHYRLAVVTGAAGSGTPLDWDVRAGGPTAANLTWNGSADGTVNTDNIVTADTVPIQTNNANILHDWNTALVQHAPEANLLGKDGSAYGALNLSLTSEAAVTGMGPGLGPVVNGERPITNNFRIDGVDNNNKVDPGPLVYIPNEAVKGFSMFENQSAPVFGHSTGGQYNETVRTGTNEVHGALYDYLENRHFGAVDESWANRGLLDRPKYDQNRLGASLGMPILPSKIFFYGNFEYTPLSFEGLAGGPAYAPTAAGFQQLAATPGISTTNLGILQSSVGTVGPATQTVTVAGQTVPVGLVNNSAREWQNRYAGTGALDFNIGSNDTAHARYTHNLIDANNSGAALTAFQTPSSTTALLATLSEDHTFTSSVTNEIRLAYNRWDQSIGAGSFTSSGLTPFPNISIAGTSNLLLGPAGLANSSIWNTYDANDTISVNWHSHTFRLGADVMRYISALDGFTSFNGNYAYSGLSQFLLDMQPDILAQRGFGSSYISDDRTLLTGFVQDSWAMRPGLTLDLGVRYYYDTLPSSLNNQSFNSIANVPGVISFGKPNTQNHNFAPNFGIAYAPGHSHTTVIRAGFGMMYDALQDPSFLYGAPYFPGLGGSLVTSSLMPTAGFLANGGLTNPAGATTTGTLTADQTRALTSTFVGDQHLPYSMQWNVAVQTKLWRATALEVKYLGAADRHLPYMSYLNQVSPVTASQSLPLYYQQPTQTALNALPTTLSSLTAMQANPLAQYGFTSPITTISNESNAWYNGLTANVNQRLGALNLIGTYTYSHLIDESTGTPLDLVLGRERATSLWDRRQRGSITGVFDMAPLFHNTFSLVRNVFTNMTLSGTYLYQTPASLPILSNGAAGLTTSAFGSAIVNPNGFGNTGSAVTPLFNNAGQTVAYLAENPSARYIATAPGMFAQNSRSNTFQLSPVNNIDLAVVKRFSYHDRWAFEARADAYNLFNHPQFTGVPTNSLTMPQLGAFSNLMIPGSLGFADPSMWTTSNPRMLQVALRVTF